MSPVIDDTLVGQECERRVRAFEEAWQQTPGPDLAAFLPDAAALRQAVLVELVHTDMELRARAGEKPDADGYLRRFPELSDGAAELRAAEERWRRPSGPGPLLAGRYELGELVGRGATGSVYRAHDRALGRTVAVKLFHAEGGAAEERFLREARSTAGLRHPHLVAVHDFGRHDGRLFLVSEFIEGKTLQTVLRDGPPSPRQSAAWLADLADALDHAHSAGVVHRDVKPSNVLIAGGKAYLVDFGLARCEADRSRLTQEGQFLGTPAYVPPEQVGGQAHEADARSDVYGLGVVLYECLAGEVPFRGNVRMVLQQVLHEEPRPPRSLNDQAPADLETVCLKAMAKEAGRRYATAVELADELRRFLRGEPVKARLPGPVGQLWRWARRKPVPAALSAALALVSVLGATGVGLALARAEREAERAREQARRAEDRLRQGQELLTAFVRACRNPGLRQPGALGVRTELLDSVARHFESHLGPAEAERLRGEVDELKRGAADEEALACTALGEVYRARGQVREARDVYRRAVALWEALAATGPPSRSARIGEAQARKGLAHVLHDDHARAEAHAQARRALDLWQQVEGERSTSEGKLALSECETFLANTTTAGVPMAQRRQAWAAARDRLRARLDDDPTDTGTRTQLATSYLIEVYALRDQGDTEEALDRLGRAIAVHRELLAQVPDDPFVCYRLGECLLLQAAFLERQGKLAQAVHAETRDLFARALSGWEVFCKANPVHQQAQSCRVLSSVHLLNLCLATNRQDLVGSTVPRARQALDALTALTPELADLLVWRAQVGCALVRHHLALGQKAPAVEAWKDVEAMIEEARERLAAESIEVPQRSETVRGGLINLGQDAFRRGHPGQGRAAFALAVRVAEAGLEKCPADPQVRRRLAETRYQQGKEENAHGDRVRARAAFEQALVDQRRVVEATDRFDERKLLDWLYRELGRCHRDLREFDAAERCFHARRPLWDRHPERLATLASDWEHLAEAVVKKEGTAEARERQTRYRKEAESLRKPAPARDRVQ